MSYGGVENTQDELDLLVGATILSLKIEDMDDFPGDSKIVMKVRLKKPCTVEHTDGTLSNTRLVTFEVWQDEEGNGPGYFALVDND